MAKSKETKVKAFFAAEDENKERGNWSGQLDFILACLGYAVGLGNVWRFPYRTYENGGGAFLIPYACMLIFAGLPLFFMELSLGQYSSRGPIAIWDCAPLCRGIGIAQVIVSAIVGIYYNCIIAYCVFYMFSSLTTSLPWTGCDHWWNSELCRELFNELNVCGDLNVTGQASTSSDDYVCMGTEWLYAAGNDTLLAHKPISPAEEYWNNAVLKLTGKFELTSLDWQMAMCLLLSWFIVYLCMVKGIKSTGKAVYFTATFPYVVLLILLIRGLTLDGMEDGIKFYVTPRWEEIISFSVWKEAAAQIFFSLSVAWGGIQALASYNRFHNNCYRDTLIVVFGNCLTSIFAGFVVFSIIGYLAKSLNTSVENAVQSGFSLAFIAYPEALSQMPGAPGWSFLFFFMLLNLGLDTQFTIIETVMTAICDQWPSLRTKKPILLVGLCLVNYAVGLLCCTNIGYYLVQMMDDYAGGYSLVFLGILEVAAFSFIYGVRRLSDNIYTMIRYVPNYYWKGCWLVISPAILLLSMLYSFIAYTPPSYIDDHLSLQEVIAWLMVAFALSFIPLTAIYVIIFKTEGSLLQRLRTGVTPLPTWGPALEQHREEEKALFGTASIPDISQHVTNPVYDESETGEEVEVVGV